MDLSLKALDFVKFGGASVDSNQLFAFQQYPLQRLLKTQRECSTIYTVGPQLDSIPNSPKLQDAS